MKLQLKNILRIADADITLNGLTVITGENDSGKSTIGKMLFTVLKTIGHSREYQRDRIMRNVKMRFRRILIIIENDPKSEEIHVVDTFKDDFDRICSDLVDGIFYVDSLKRDIIVPLTVEKFSPRTISLVKSEFSAINRQVEKILKPDSAIMKEFRTICNSEFNDNLTSFDKTESAVTLSSFGGKNGIFHIEIKNNETESCKFSGGEFFNDVTYVESPLFLSLIDFLGKTSIFRLAGANRNSSGEIPLHLADFAGKISYFAASGNEPSIFSSEADPMLLSELERIMGGKFEGDKKKRAINYIKNGHTIRPGNVASGIKSFGIIQTLLQSGFITPENLLIWDEPENHLHPHWQVEFARILLLLVKSGIPVVISTHSPYFVQGIRYFSAMYGVENAVNYYMATSDSDTALSRFVDVSGNLNEVFTKLAGPLNDIMNVDEARMYGRQNPDNHDA